MERAIYNFLLANFAITLIPYLFLGAGFVGGGIELWSLWRVIVGLILLGIIGIKFAILFYLSPYFEE